MVVVVVVVALAAAMKMVVKTMVMVMVLVEAAAAVAVAVVTTVRPLARGRMGAREGCTVRGRNAEIIAGPIAALVVATKGGEQTTWIVLWWLKTMVIPAPTVVRSRVMWLNRRCRFKPVRRTSLLQIRFKVRCLRQVRRRRGWYGATIRTTRTAFGRG